MSMEKLSNPENESSEKAKQHVAAALDDINSAIARKDGKVNVSIASYSLHLILNMPVDIPSIMRECAKLPANAGREEEFANLAQEWEGFYPAHVGKTEETNASEVVEKSKSLLERCKHMLEIVPGV